MHRQHSLTLYKRWYKHIFLKKWYTKATTLPQPFFGGISLYELCMYRMADSYTLTWSEGGTGMVQASMNGILQACSRKYFKQRKVLHVHGIKQEGQRWTVYRQVCILYSQPTSTYIRKKVHISLFIPCSDQAYTRTYWIYIHVLIHTCLDLVIQCIYKVYASNVQVHVSMHIPHRMQKQKVD